MITDKHRQRVESFFDKFMLAVRRRSSIPVKQLQKMLGLQIWISTVFRVARQFLTSICDIIRVTQKSHFFRLQKYPELGPRAVKDLSFWRRLVKSRATMSFDYMLSRLPVNKSLLSSDASGSFGMAGVQLFNRPHPRHSGYSGLFWQCSWEQWEKIWPLADLKPGQVMINVAEFLAALITIETFAPDCAGKLTYLELDNTSANSWLRTARCPRYPFDRCAQGTHLYMLSKDIKISSRWIPTGENKVADKCSRKNFYKKSPGHMVGELKLLKVKPKWLNVLKFK